MLVRDRSRWGVLLLILALGGVSVFGFWQLLVLRFQAGDVYPPYSSLRADPLGTKVLYNALEATPGFTVSRNFQPLDKMSQQDGMLILLVGAPTDAWPAEDVTALEKLATGGARVVIAFYPTEQAVKGEEGEYRSKPEKSPKPGKAKESKEEKEAQKELSITLGEMGRRWGFKLIRREAQKGEAPSPTLTVNAMTPDTEPSLSWHTALCFSNPSAAWQVLYRCDGAPAIMQRPFGKGSIALAADSYFLSNEAMRNERAPKLLGWVAGPESRVVFDETHLGVQENAGIATLIRKYRLDGLLAAMGVLGILFVWHASVSFLPRMPEGVEGDIVTGKDSASGFVSLLRRGDRAIAADRRLRGPVEEIAGAQPWQSGRKDRRSRGDRGRRRKRPAWRIPGNQ